MAETVRERYRTAVRCFHTRCVVVLLGSLAGAASLVLAPGLPLGVQPAYAARSYAGRGVVRSIAQDRMSITIAHEAIPGFMPAMTMSFEARSPSQLDGLHPDDHVTFSFTVTDDGRRLVDAIRRSGHVG